jgi:hypothetical protein
VDADTTGLVQESVFFAVANLLNLEVDLLSPGGCSWPRRR